VFNRKRVTWLMPVEFGTPYVDESLAWIGTRMYASQEISVWGYGSTGGTAGRVPALDAVANRWVECVS
jgi:hypothetical protein